MSSAKIIGMGKYLPANIVFSSDLDKKLNLPEGSVQKKSGLVSRHFARVSETTSYMASQAALHAVEQAGITLAEIDAIIGACGAGEQPIPCTAVLVQKRLGLDNSGIACFDINSTCLSFLTALDAASYMLSGGRFNRILIVSSDIPSFGLDWSDLETCTIFGDGAAACVVERSNDYSRILAAHMKTYSFGADFCQVQAGGTFMPPASEYDKKYGLFKMDGKRVFKLASQMIGPMQEELFAKASITLNDVDWVVPHQASLLAMHHIRKKLGIPGEKFVDIYTTHGNQMAASLPSALCHLIHNHNLERGQLVYLLGTGAGLSAAGMILEY
ncbi:TPA: beta-ketoacyl-ACP synthase III [Legionella pneumophila]|uniref:beta-ketoacyl-ACP synthase III n=1 Tax=Legionella pneumophila TaxID=446 RepID=UPI0004874238|nr:beta-ketoacyl-ACP synthase III [Legionella pneumophila]MCZ4685625.1 beta-ketoacyl-ACP synthase III [Legionella pneumophila]STX99061.1 chalcone and stilbene synthase [Legionella pneumophila]HAT1773794.1 beta-ketoacyl-ACP synthase III [Legionella pneumophila]HAT1776941.1 beta-ketoacyl-ACP synthase III [Legionella pneumophila]HAT1779728.1 beta-ketoacyl-ACP synthase III [Legionella pneumophila]